LIAPTDRVPAVFRPWKENASRWDYSTGCRSCRPTSGNPWTKRDRGNWRRRWFAKAVERANEKRAKGDAAPLPEGLTPHSLRRTFISLLLAIGEEVPYVMRQVGHSDPKVTLSIYAHVMFGGERERERLKSLVKSSQWAPAAILRPLSPVSNSHLSGGKLA
jgi:integrase